MKYSEFKRWLKQQGATFEQGKGSHELVRLGGKTSVFPNHGSKEVKKGLEKKTQIQV